MENNLFCSLIQIKIEQGQKASFRLLLKVHKEKLKINIVFVNFRTFPFFENELDQTRRLWIFIFDIFEVFFEENLQSAQVLFQFKLN